MLTDPLGLVEQTLLDRYRVLKPVARGGMGVVYRGEDQRLKRPVCIKIFYRLAGSEAVNRASHDHFVREAFALSRLSHPNTLRIYDFGHLPDQTRTPFYVSEWLEGGTLGQWVRGAGPRSLRETLQLIAPIAGALSEAHARGIVHRDVKPSNIILGSVGSSPMAKLGDFGIAMASGELEPEYLRAPGPEQAAVVRLYSLGWAAPEQLRGDPVGPWTDVFGLGLVTAFALSGRPVFSGRDGEEALLRECEHDAHLTDRLIELALHPELVRVVQTACRAEPSERYVSADSFISALSKAGRRRDVRSAELDPDSAWDDPESESSALLLPAVAPEGTPPRTGMNQTTKRLRGGAAARAERAKSPYDADFFVDCARDRELLLNGRKLIVLGMKGTAPLDLGGASLELPSRARFRITLLPSHQTTPRVNLKGLNCFVAPVSGRPATAVNLDHDMELEFLACDREPLERVACSLGQACGEQQVCRVGTFSVTIAGAASGAVLLDLGPGRELALIHGGARAPFAGGSA